MTKPLESGITGRIVKFLNSLPRCKAQKLHMGGWTLAGEPDIDCCYRGQTLKLEVKRDPAQEPTKLQYQRLAAWAEAGAVVAVVTSVAEVRELIATLDIAGPAAVAASSCGLRASEPRLPCVGKTWRDHAEAREEFSDGE